MHAGRVSDGVFEPKINEVAAHESLDASVTAINEGHHGRTLPSRLILHLIDR